MILRPIVPGPAATHAGAAIHLGGVILTHLLHPVVAVGHPVACRLITCRHHHKRGVIAVFVDDTLRLFQQILVNLLSPAQPHTMIRPRGSLWLQVDTHPVGSEEGSLWRTVAMEAHMVQTILLTFHEDLHPRLLVSWRITRLWEAAVLYRSSQEYRNIVDKHLTALDANLPESHQRLEDILASRDSQMIEVRMMLVPEFDILTQGNIYCQFIAFSIHGSVYQRLASLRSYRLIELATHIIVVKGEYPQTIDMVLQHHGHTAYRHLDLFTLYMLATYPSARQGNLGTVHLDRYAFDVQLLPLRLQLYASCDAVPVALCLVCHAV